ncbi:MAG TPA: prolyl oligopeptidase family serine peptidase [Kofleriaceae bacterium]|nr:prolyl oligopeptidase family serine peptidase [Kofleriaceae bacterium]
MKVTTLFLVPLIMSACAHAPSQPAPPVVTGTPTEEPAVPAPDASTEPATTAASDPATDPYLWLEKVDGTRAMAWVKKQNARTLDSFGKGPAFDALKKDIREVLDSKDKIPYVSRRGRYLYNFWTDADHPRGLWRRTTLAQYRKDSPKWQVLLDIDALGKKEGKSWVFHGAQCLKPTYRRCLVMLSGGGADAHVVREFDTTRRAFVDGGFSLPEAKSEVAWIDKNAIYVGTDFGPGSMTESGYPRIVKEWKRGTDLGEAKMVYEGKAADLAVSAFRDLTPGFQRDFVQRQIDFYHSETYLRTDDGSLEKVDIPLDANLGINREWLTIELRTPWTVAGTTYPAGALLAAKFDAFMKGKRELTVLFEPDGKTFLSSMSWTRHHLLLNEMHDVASRIEVLTPRAGEWKREPLGGAPALATLAASGTDPDHTDEYFLTETGFLDPTTLARGILGRRKPQVLKRTPAFFDASGKTVQQFFATSKDGTRVPYFVVGPKDMKTDGQNPTLLYGYGGFEVSLRPFYSGSVGRGWLSRGGVYVVANIRGGGEYGPKWHEAALKANRLLAYQDFAAVAKDLVARHITSPEHLAAEGGSNGGLLVGNMLVLYPELFGAIACEVPLLDMKRYTHIAAGASWVAEYGDPDDPEQWAFIRTFSPYQLVRDGKSYPSVLFTTTTRDDRVGPQHARKMAAKMLSFGDDVYFYENTEGGHGSGADSEQKARMEAVQLTFLWEHIGDVAGKKAAASVTSKSP